MFREKYELTIDKILTSPIRNNPNQVISYRGEKRVTYSEFKENVYRIARGLVKLGLKKGDRVAVMDWDSLDYMYLYFAVPIAGGVLHTVNIRYSPELIFYTMKHADDKFVVIRDEFVPLIEKAIGMFDFVKQWIVVTDHEQPIATLTGSTLLRDVFEESNGIELPTLSEDDLATTFYTSGTTGLPKGVQFTHRQIMLHTLVSNAVLAQDPASWRAKDVVLPLVPMFHVHSWGAPYACVNYGMKYVLPGKYEFDKLPGIMEKEGVTVSMMVPSILYMLISRPESIEILSKLKLRVTVGGGALPKGLADKATQIGLSVSAGYGMSETAPILTLGMYTTQTRDLEPTAREEERLKTGVPIPLVDLKVIDSDYNEVPWDGKSIGEIVVKAPWLTTEYVKDEDSTKKLWENNWMHTGDLAVVDNLGYVSIVDREKDAVKSGGEFIPTVVIEDAISTFPGVAEVAIVGRKDEKWGERPVAFVTGMPTVDKQAIVNHLMKSVDSGRIAKFWIPDEFIPIESFEKTSTGKIDKKPLRQRLST